MKILLVGVNAKYIHPCLSLYQLKANTSYKVSILEFTIKENVEDIFKEIINNTPDLIGFSCYLWNIEIVSQLVDMIKKHSNHIKVFLGGPEVSYDVNYFLKNLPIDFIMNGEGEHAFELLLDYFHDKIPLKAVPSISYRQNNEIITHSMVVPDLSKIKIAAFEVESYSKRIMYLESSRGCPFNCSYCVASLDRKVRFFPIENVLSLLKRAMSEQIPTVKFLDRTFNVDKKRLLLIMQTIEQYNISTTFQFEIMADRLDDEIIQYLLRLKSKYLRFEIGIQSTNYQVNSAVNRYQDIDLLKENILKIKEANAVDLHLDLIAGLPFETKESFINSFNEVISLKPLELQLGFLKFLRGTDIMKMINQHDYIYSSNPPYEIISNKYMSSNDLDEIRMVEVTLNKYYNSGWFKKTFDEIFKIQNMSFYHFFLDFYIYAQKKDFTFIHYQRYDLYMLLDLFIQESTFPNKDFIAFLIKLDYLSLSRTRPKKWWSDTMTKETRNIVYKLIEDKIEPFTIEDVYRYSVLLIFKDNIYICFYKNYQATSYHISLHEIGSLSI